MDIYIRVSRLGERDEQEATEVYEAQCRAWADQHGAEVGEVADDTDVSGSVAVAERGLEGLIKRIESGESDGIITPYLDRFGRDLIEGALAYKRISEANGRLVCVRDGLDSDRQGDKLQFNVRMAFAEDYLDRVKENWNTANERMVAEGLWPAPRIPFGYRKDPETRTLVVDKAEEAVVKELFKRRAGGENVMSLMRWMRNRCEREGLRAANVTRNGVRTVLANEVYLGTTAYPRGRKDNPIVKQTHAPILTREQWELAQIKHHFTPRTGKASEARLRGLVFCATCGKRCKVGANGPPHKRRTNYVCTAPGCTSRSSITTAKLDGYVEGELAQASADREPHVEAVILGDTRFQDALQAVEEARRLFEEFRDSVELQRELGIKGFAAGLRARREALDYARSELGRVRPARRAAEWRAAAGEAMNRKAVEDAIAAANLERFVDRIVLHSTKDGKPAPAAERTEIFWTGSDAPYRPSYAAIPTGS